MLVSRIIGVYDWEYSFGRSWICKALHRRRNLFRRCRSAGQSRLFHSRRPMGHPRPTWVCKIYRLTLTLTPLATLISFLEAELFSQALARASSLSYTAGMSDFDSINTFEKGKEVSSADDSSLEQARRAISDARTSLDKCLSILIQT